MGKLRGFYALFVTIAVLCLNTFAFATDNHQKKDNRSSILSAAGDQHDVYIQFRNAPVVYQQTPEMIILPVQYLGAGSTRVIHYVQIPIPATSAADQYNELEICPEDFIVAKDDRNSVGFKGLYNIIEQYTIFHRSVFDYDIPVFFYNEKDKAQLLDSDMHFDPGLTFYTL